MSTKTQTEKLIKRILSSIQLHLLTEYKKFQNKENPKTQDKQIQLIKKMICDFLKVGRNKQNQCKNTNQKKQQNTQFLFIQQNYLDQTEKIDRIKKQMEIEFEMTKGFISTFLKDQQIKNVQFDNSNLSQNLTDYRKVKQFKLDLFKITQEPTQKTLRKVCTTDRLPKIKTQQLIDDQFADQLNQTTEKNKTLQRLKKLQKFLYEKQNIGSLCRSTSKMWTFSPPKAYYKLQNQSLKILQQNLRTQLQIIQNDRNSNLNETILRRQQNLKKKEQRLTNLQSELFKKEMQLNKRHSQILRKQQQLKKVQTY